MIAAALLSSRLDPADRRALMSLLDQLCEHEESVIDCHTIDGEPGPGRGSVDVIGYEAVRRSRRVWRRAQDLLIKLAAGSSMVMA